MTQQGGSSPRVGTIIAVITAIGSIVGFIVLIVGPFLEIPGFPERLCVLVRLCERAEFTIKVDPDPELRADFEVSIDGEPVADLSTNAGPYSVPVSRFEEGSYSYDLKATYYDGCWDAASQQYLECNPPIERSDEDTISVQDGAVFTMYGHNPNNVELKRTR